MNSLIKVLMFSLYLSEKKSGFLKIDATICRMYFVFTESFSD